MSKQRKLTFNLPKPDADKILNTAFGRGMAEVIAECQNNRDMVAGVDAAIGQVSYDLIYERKTDKDYE